MSEHVDSVNPTLPYAFRLVIPGESQIMYDIINLNTPTISVGKSSTYHQDSIINVPNDVYELDDVSFTMILSDGWVGYKRLIEWQKKSKQHEKGFKKNVSILIFNGDFSIKTGEMGLFGAWPTSIGSINFDYQSPDAMVMQLPVSMSIDGDIVVN